VISAVVGDATRPARTGAPRVICHVCNNRGAWGAGFVLAVSRRWAAPEAAYLAVDRDLPLGRVQLVQVEPDLYVANMIAQDGFPSRGRPCALDYKALENCLTWLSLYAGEGWSFHMPRIGCGIAGGKWSVVQEIIERTLGDWPVTVYDLSAAYSEVSP
jgi:O-acetyl-ADP-ribose deacetylase (regulator of RNase III)